LPGHSLVITKRHIKSFFGLKDIEVKELFKVIKKATKALMKVYDSDGFDLAIQEGEAAGQSIEHFHIHIIPRKKGDMKGDPSQWFVNLLSSGLRIMSEKDMKENVDKIKRVIR
jgi:bis(5'-adenosyl)-triphosphatase